MTPFVKLFREQLDYNNLKVFGCRCFSYNKGNNKFSPKTYPCVFIGYNSLHKGYRCYHSFTRRVYISRHDVLDENTLPDVSSNKPQTNIDVSSHLATFVESFSKLQTPDNCDSGEVHVASPPITCDNAATPHVLIDDKGIIDLSSTVSDVEEL